MPKLRKQMYLYFRDQNPAVCCSSPIPQPCVCATQEGFQKGHYWVSAILLPAFQIGEFLVSCCSWVEVNGKERGSQSHSKVPGMTPAPLAHWALCLCCHFVRWAIGRRRHPNHINWNHLLSQESSISISMWMLMCYAWYLAGVRLSSLIAYIPNLLSLPIFILQSNHGWKSVCNMSSSIFNSFHFGQILPRKK